MVRIFIAVFVILATLNFIHALSFSRCELVKTLLEYEVVKDQLADWVCLVENESGRNTSAVGGPNKNDSYDYGLFQINNRYWCDEEQPGGDCNIVCNKLRDDDITDDMKCVGKIYKRHGFYAWHGWKRRCENQTLPNIDNCF